MRIGLLANSEVSVSAFVEEGDRVIAHVHRVGDDEAEPPERFLVAEVHDGQITAPRRLRDRTRGTRRASRRRATDDRAAIAPLGA